jgi:hypothetical protein
MAVWWNSWVKLEVQSGSLDNFSGLAAEGRMSFSLCAVIAKVDLSKRLAQESIPQAKPDLLRNRRAFSALRLHSCRALSSETRPQLPPSPLIWQEESAQKEVSGQFLFPILD